MHTPTSHNPHTRHFQINNKKDKKSDTGQDKHDKTRQDKTRQQWRHSQGKCERFNHMILKCTSAWKWQGRHI